MFKSKLIIILIMISLFSSKINASYEKLAFDFSFKDLDGSNLELSEFRNKVLVITNVASYCGFTSQYEDLQEIWNRYQKKRTSSYWCSIKLFQSGNGYKQRY